MRYISAQAIRVDLTMKIFAVSIVYALLALSAQSAVIQDNGASTFITNGQNETGSAPFYGYLEIFRSTTVYFGGSALISSKVSITVAQNVEGFIRWRVGLGANRISELNWHLVERAIAHPDYNSNTLINNIALLIFSQPITLTSNIRYIPMAPPGGLFPLPQTTGTFFGFGFGQIDQQPEILQRATFRVLSQSECGIAYNHLVLENHLDNYFCAIDPIDNANICAGDQGGAIFNPQFNMMFGIASFIRDGNCNSPESTPAAFIRITEYRNWIDPYLD